MAHCVLLRHGRSTANSEGVLAGWTDGVHLDEAGRRQAADVADRLAHLPFARVVTSPLLRCRETARPLAEALGVTPEVHDGLGEARYGAWTGRALSELAKEDLWQTVQRRPSEAVFPESEEYPHESILQMAQRAVAAVRAIDAEVEAQSGPGAIWLAVSHGDIIKSVLADAAATPLDEFQRYVVDPASVSVVRYAPERAFVLRVNDSGPLAAPKEPPAETPGSDAAVGGGAG
ncbi:histidine phosphatase family protein [Marihabitans asiaticum]|uniref:Putative phosphomutase (TIGR03848 family) n=1 Tax=Marihabitans asiaticum TaxID=415218 RepID=A0A560W6T1_9MICO|nr:MSMEG_4193 family putative phosphomutase [Marihabitans asiaticum]TWD13205.1 putative phosphomutase (TIGR03848 family) [Marihabitans asiaticum]